MLSAFSVIKSHKVMAKKREIGVAGREKGPSGSEPGARGQVRSHRETHQVAEGQVILRGAQTTNDVEIIVIRAEKRENQVVTSHHSQIIYSRWFKDLV